MSKTVSFSLDDRLTEFVETQIAAGRYASVDDVVTAALRLLQDEQDHVAEMRMALIEGEDSGPSAPFDFEEFVARKRQKATNR